MVFQFSNYDICHVLNTVAFTNESQAISFSSVARFSRASYMYIYDSHVAFCSPINLKCSKFYKVNACYLL